MMTRHKCLPGLIHLLFAFGLLIGGCPCQQPIDGPPDTDDGTTSGSGTNSGQTDGQTDRPDSDDGCDTLRRLGECGSRTVAGVPTLVYVERRTVASESTVQPSDSPLARVMFPWLLCPYDNDRSPSVEAKTLYEVGDGGVILAIVTLNEFLGEKLARRTPMDGWRFIVDDGCLELETQYSTTMLDPTDLLTDNRCGCAAFPLGKSGVYLFVGTEEPQICIRLEVEQVCCDCWYEDGVWHERCSSSISYVAEGSLNGVAAGIYAEFCGGETTVDIRSGDRVTVTRFDDIEYRLSPSPTELGYTVNSSGDESQWFYVAARRQSNELSRACPQGQEEILRETWYSPSGLRD